MTEAANFYNLGIAPAMLQVVDRLKYTVPTPIQAQAIPIAMQGKDVLGIAQTGTGKTLAFGIPMIQRLSQGPGRALVIVPTRELALQVDETLRKLGQPFDARSVILIGGMSMSVQVQVLRKPTTRVLIATPGRLLDHLQHRTVKLDDMKVVVLDEADRMLDMGFAPQIHKIAKYLPKERQTLFFSATMPEEILKIATEYMNLPIRVEIARAGTAPEKIVQELFIVKQESKLKLLSKLLEQYHGSVLVFLRTKAGAKKATRILRDMKLTAAEIHANRSLMQRREALEGFKTGRYRVLVATDIAARGIDVKGIELVINYDLPQNSEDYVHRIGRTGRAGREGHAISFATPDQGSDVRDIEKLLQMSLKVATHGDVPTERFSHGSAPKQGGQHQRHQRRPFQGGGQYGRSNSGYQQGGGQYGRPQSGGQHNRPQGGGQQQGRPQPGGGQHSRPQGGSQSGHGQQGGQQGSNRRPFRGPRPGGDRGFSGRSWR